MKLRWIDIIKEITDIAIFESGDDFDELTLTIKFSMEDDWIESLCEIVKDGKSDTPIIWDDALDELKELTFALHQAVKDHTGGDLKGYTIRIDETGKAKSNFQYHDP